MLDGGFPGGSGFIWFDVRTYVVMTLERWISRVFGLDDEAWMRHANPWSVWTRSMALPLLVVSFWSREWLGWWAVIPVMLSVAWIFVNPRVFPEPDSTDNWASKSVLGERVWMNRDEIPVPSRHRRAPHLLNLVAAIGGLLGVWGVIALQVWPTVLGVTLVYLGKLWYLDRMAWLYEDMKHVDRYKEWLY